MQQSDAATKFIDKVLEQKGTEGLDADVIAQLRNDLLDRLDRITNKAIINSLSPEQQIKLEHLIDTNQIDKIHVYVESVGVNVQGIVARSMAQLQKDYLGI